MRHDCTSVNADRMFKPAFDEISLAYMCQDETIKGFGTFLTQMIIRFKVDEVEIEFENGVLSVSFTKTKKVTLPNKGC